ncbi:Ferric/cupric reductase transmembrane component 2 [Tolypocladium ophioglossoides CBS 100239]|uniref:Ferric/cupric reductase transmembrane component 2 n=1 Tax=Tolypocladium ophioglossoides (strain CBS 100239) TaxID=1163406 RepID=A0A0L0N6H8_TOLOC|nr:Ferric/cupric reductase transmembrane component 2 [Tolypocladium ophioglossoides CBS 100239]
MGFRQVAFICASLLFHSAQAGVTSYGDGFGFVGYGIQLYRPECAWACLFCIAPPLNCTAEDMAAAVTTKRDVAEKSPKLPSGDGWEVTLQPTPRCQQNNDFFLQTVANCLKSRCADVPLRALDNFWDANVPFLYDGDKKDQPVPRQGYTQVLGAIKDAPTQPLNKTVLLNYTAAIPDEIYQPEYDTIHSFASNEVTHDRYALVIFLSGVVMPIAFSLLRFLPWPASWVTRFNAYLVDPPAVGSQHSAPVWGLGIMPTRGQALFIAYFWLINIFLSAFGYGIFNPSLFYDSQSYEVQTYIANRFGILSFAHLPLVFLYAGRNNILLWLTNWSHSTFLLMHRWAGFLCMLHAVLHSLVYLHMAVAHVGGLDHAVESVQPYWYWGIIATLSMSIMVLASTQPVRQKMYELFLASHIALAVMAIVGCYYHITPKYGLEWGFQSWLYISIAVWVFDRAARLVRSVRGGIKRAFLTPIDDDYYRLDIPGATASGHIYLHFPSVSRWRFWENHPFSVAGVTRCSSHMPNPVHVPVEGNSDQEAEKTVQASDNQGSRTSTGSEAAQPYSSSGMGVVVFIRKHDGITSLLSKRGTGPKGIPVMVEGPYSPGVTFLQDGHVSPTHEFPNLICIAGGVGITGILPSLDSFTAATRPVGRKKLYWGVRTMPLVHSVEKMLGYDGKEALDRRWGDVDVTLSVGERFDLRSLLESDLCSQQGGTTVVVCGPPGMADDVRCIVSGLSRHSGANGPVLVKLVVESFSW